MPVKDNLSIDDKRDLHSVRNVRTLLIEPFKQVRFGLYIIGLTSIFTLGAGWFFVQAFQDQYQQVISIFEVVSESQWDLVVNDVFLANAWKLAIFLFIYYIVTLAVVIRQTHRYYGPLVSIRRFLNDLVEERYDKRIAIRQEDELQEVVAHLNQLAMVLEERHTKR